MDPKSQASRTSRHTVLSGATLYDHDEEADEEATSPPKEPSYDKKQRKVARDIHSLKRRMPWNLLGGKLSSPLRHSTTDGDRNWRPYSEPPVDAASHQTHSGLHTRLEENTHRESMAQAKRGDKMPRKPKSSNYVAFVENYNEPNQSSMSDDETPSDSSSNSLHPSDAASAQLQLTTMEFSQISNHTKHSRSINVRIDPRYPQDVTIHSELNATDDLEEDLEQYSRLVTLGRFKAAQTQFDRRLLHFVDNPYVLDQYCAGLRAACDFHALSQVEQKFALEIRPGTLRTSIYMHLDQARSYCGLYGNIGLGWTQRNVAIAAMFQRGFPNPYRHHELAQVYLHLRDEGRIWEFRNLLANLLHSYRYCVSGALGILLADNGEETDERLIKMVERIEDDWGTTTPNEESSFALLDIFTTLTLSSMNARTNPTTVKTIFEFSQSHALEVVGIQSTNTKTRPYLRWIIAKVLLEQYVDPKITGVFALASHIRKIRGLQHVLDVNLPLSGMVTVGLEVQFDRG
ncbi:hypothetical protein BDP81DRAFT_503328 [Colletotrichum phormii]|uniref:Uncharacterized protein n=1 Tax=Colletotrichum phormii TaxID=359342 RepID=A0AAI9ZFH0_9PEZI|nr:uncharacterized protein BDP81DRAFT_503328 [Colletotrichum phormii]KAK1623592.1 hypothetical protein BDP81DRAFT_503328 [Colletotrichum phormii]